MKVFFGIVLLLTSHLLLAQNSTLRGKVLDAKDNGPVSYATIAVFKAGIPVDGTIADSLGTFRLKVKPGFDSLQISFLGYETQHLLPSDIQSQGKEIQVLLAPATNTLDDITVTGERSVTEQQIDRRVINLGADLQQAGASAMEALDQISEIQTDPSTGNISFRGNGDVRLFINGKPSGMSQSELLQQIPAASIDRIEIITAPSAKEQANGIAGILNIVLKKDASQGLNVKLNSGYGNYRYNYGLNSNYSKRKFNLRFNVNREHQDRISDQDIARQYTDGRIESIFTPHLFEGTLTRVTTGIDVFADNKNEFSFDWEYTDDRHSFYNESVYTNMNDREDFDYLRNSAHFHKVNTFNANYRHQFTDDKHALEIDYNLNVIDNFFPASDFLEGALVLEEEFQYDNQLQFFGLDYVSPLSKKASFETGLAWNKRVLKSDYRFSDSEADALNAFDYEEDVMAAYVQVRWNLSRLKIQTGLRYEYFESESKSSRAPFLTQKDFSNLFPSLHLSYSITDNQQLTAGYSQRIARPNFNHLNPFQLGNPYFRFVGNPDLQPEIANSAELSYRYTESRYDFSLTTFYRHRKSVIQQLTTFNSEGLQLISYINGGLNHSTGIEGSFNYEVDSFWNISFSANYYHTNIDERQLVTWNRVYSSTLQLRNSFKISNSLSVDLSYRHDPQRQLPFRYIEARDRLDLAVRARLLNNKLSLNLRAIDLLYSNLQKRYNITPGGNQQETWRFATQTRGFLLSAAYTLFENGALKRTRKTRDYRHGGAID